MNPLTNIKNINKLNEIEAELGVSSKVSWHQQYKDSAYIYIGGLPYKLTEGDILAVFSQYGEIVNINLVRDKKTGKSQGYCFIAYEDQRSTILAVDNFNGIQLLGRTIRVDHVANYRPPKEYEDDDEVTKRLRLEGCAPKIEPDSPHPAEDDEPSPKKLKKEKKSKKDKEGKKKKKKKKKMNRDEKDNDSSENSSDTESDDDSQKQKMSKNLGQRSQNKISKGFSDRTNDHIHHSDHRTSLHEKDKEDRKISSDSSGSFKKEERREVGRRYREDEKRLERSKDSERQREHSHKERWREDKDKEYRYRDREDRRDRHRDRGKYYPESNIGGREDRRRRDEGSRDKYDRDRRDGRR